MRGKPALTTLLLALTACSGQSNAIDSAVPASPSTSASRPAEVARLADGEITPGRYQYALRDWCEHAVGCPVDQQPVLPSIEITVPDGWSADLGFQTLWPVSGRDTTSPNNPGLALGWTTSWVRLFSNPCLPEKPPPADIAVGPTVDDFVSAVTAHRSLDVTAPKPVTLGRHHGQFLTLQGPANTKGCAQWQPWDPAPYVQGASNTWDMWVMNVDGVRVVIMAEYFPATPPQIKTELRQMAESIRFVPNNS